MAYLNWSKIDPVERIGSTRSRSIPSFLLKHVKLSEQARRIMSNYENDRVCDLDVSSDRRVFVFDARSMLEHEAASSHCDEMTWSQKKLADAAKKDDTLRISRKGITGTDVGIIQGDLYQGDELAAYRDHPLLLSKIASFKLGHFQAEFHDYVYILSTKGS